MLAVKIPAKSDAVAENEPRINLENNTFLRTIVLKWPVVKNDDIIIDWRILLRLVSVFEINDKCKIIKTRQSSTSVSFVLPLVSHFEYTLHRTLCAKVASSTKREHITYHIAGAGASAAGNMQENLVKFGHAVPEICVRTDIKTGMLITILRFRGTVAKVTNVND